MPETIKLLGSNENKITKNKNGENVPHPKITEAVLFLCNIVSNHYEKYSRVLHTFFLKKIMMVMIFLKTFNSVFQAIEVWFTD